MGHWMEKSLISLQKILRERNYFVKSLRCYKLFATIILSSLFLSNERKHILLGVCNQSFTHH